MPSPLLILLNGHPREYIVAYCNGVIAHRYIITSFKFVSLWVFISSFYANSENFNIRSKATHLRSVWDHKYPCQYLCVESAVSWQVPSLRMDKMQWNI